MTEQAPMPHVVVIIPGILGSVLGRDGKDVWAISGGAIIRGLLSLGGTIKQLELEEDPIDEDNVDGVVASRLISDVHLLPGFWKIDGYTELTQAIQRDFQVEKDKNLVAFPYDWRRDIRVAARQLQRESDKWLTTWRDQSGNAGAKLVIVAHSLGGLVARYFLECMEGWRVTSRLVTFGTPYRGSLNALDSLANGVRHKLGPVDLLDLTALVRSMTSSYQLLPTFKCYDPGTGGELVRVAEAPTPIEGVDPAKAAAALAVHDEIRAAVAANETDGAYLRDRYHVNLVAGEIQPTYQSARWTGDKVELLKTHQGQDHGGDGTVPRMSATPIELENHEREVWASERHSRLQNFDPVLSHLHGVLTADQLDLSHYRAGPGELAPARLSLELDDAYLAGEPVEFDVRPEWPGVALRAAVERVDGGEVARPPVADTDEEWRRVALPPLEPGTYRVSIGGPGAVTVSDVFVVLPTQGP